jgi:hypothetical protein
MTASGNPQSSQQTTDMFMRSALQDAADDALIVSCPACIKATVPVPDPQRAVHLTHCYRCGAEYAIHPCVQCGAPAILPLGQTDASACICESCH